MLGSVVSVLSWGYRQVYGEQGDSKDTKVDFQTSAQRKASLSRKTWEGMAPWAVENLGLPYFIPGKIDQSRVRIDDFKDQES